MTRSKPFTAPFTVRIDTREQLPYTFEGLRFDADRDYVPMTVPCEVGTLKTGDYSIVGMEDLVTVERKSLADLYSTLGQGRERFEEEHRRMAELVFAAVVIEADWQTILRYPPSHSQLNPKCVFRTMLSWQQRYGVVWMAIGVPMPPTLGDVPPELIPPRVRELMAEERIPVQSRVQWEHALREDIRATNSRRLAEATTFRLLEKFWQHQHKPFPKRRQSPC